ncbi:LPO_1073/Vpar_1526 family protein [Aquimarina sp. 2304DJ70-9]|uniref:LPO_1073/Vpar_1526 family protein n=1 Tax=Aquimarina penaris TaxID=3231044 RepID=UPI003461FC3E
MMNDKNLKQEGGEKSTNYQANNLTINGISYSDAKEIFEDLFRSNFLQLKDEAAAIAQLRAKEITDQFLANLIEKSPDSFNNLNQPAIQDVIFKMQKAYAISGEKEIRNILVELITHRIILPFRSYHQILLEEAIDKVPKLSGEQMDVLTLVYLIKNTNFREVKDHSDLLQLIKEEVYPFIKNNNDFFVHYNHFKFLGCANATVRDGSFLEKLIRQYPGLFRKGMSVEDITGNLGGTLDFVSDSNKNFDNWFTSCLNTSGFYQFKAISNLEFDKMLEDNDLNQTQRSTLLKFFNYDIMNLDEGRQMLLNRDSEFDKIILFDQKIKNPFILTHLGILLGNINFNIKSGSSKELPPEIINN